MDPRRELTALRNFVLKGNVVDIAAGTIISAAFGSLVSKIVEDMLGPVLSLVTGKTMSDQFLVIKSGPKAPYKTQAEAKDDGAVVLRWGKCFDAALNLVLQGICLFVVIRVIHHAKRTIM
jgi:large conductance mechanosensitive channel